MFSFIRKLQQKPEPQRRVIAFWTALAVTAFIVVLWLVSLLVRLDGVPVAGEAPVEEVSPMESLSGMLDSFLSTFRKSQ